jgi:hypothetical protein
MLTRFRMTHAHRIASNCASTDGLVALARRLHGDAAQNCQPSFSTFTRRRIAAHRVASIRFGDWLSQSAK